MSPDTPAADGLQHLIEHIQDAVVAFELVGGDPVIRGVNEAFIETFGYAADEAIGTDLNELVVPPWLRDEAAELDERTESGEINYQQVERQTADGLREFLYRGVPYADPNGSTDGYAVYTDLTETTRSERQLKVLNRLLRHNLRNTAAVIQGNVDIVLDAVDTADSDTVDAATAARDAAEALRKLSEEATQINLVLDSRTERANDVDITPIVDDVAEQFGRQNRSAVIGTEFPESLSVVVTTEFRAAIEALVENAIVHNPSSSPRVAIRTRPGPEPDWIDVLIEDDGPVIPAIERDVISGGAEITQTCHGQGLGLWLVKWIVDRSGGQLLFEESEMGGNRVCLRLLRSD